MKNTLFLTVISLLFLCFAGCDEWRGIRGNGHIITEQRPVSAFTRIKASGFYRLQWQPGAPSCSLTTDENLLSHIKTTMEGDVLRIELEDSVAPTHGIKVALTSPSLTGADLGGAAEMEATQLNGGTFALQTGGATKVTLAGKVNRLLADLTGASKLQAADLAAGDVELSVTGAGKATVNATDLLKAAITGAGEVRYSGNPKSVEKHITGAGKIAPVD